MIRCKVCKGTNVELIAWIDPNTSHVSEWAADLDSDSEAFCHDCEEHGTLECHEVIS